MGVNVAGTIGGVTGAGSGQTLTGATGSDSAGLQLLVSGGPTGSRGTVNFSRGYAHQLDQLANGFLGSSGTIASRTDGINSTIKDIGKQRDTLNLRLAGIQKRYLAQFTALDRMLSSMNATSAYLAQQLDDLPGFHASSSKR
jgi:flagellar hook-associated protein 2